MSLDELAKTVIVQLPNFAGLLICIVVLVQIIVRQQKTIEMKDRRIDELCGDKTPGEIEP